MARGFVPAWYAAFSVNGHASGMTLHERIRNLRLERGLDQYAVAAAIDVARPTVTQWEGGRKKPGREHIVKLAQFYGVTVGYLLDGERPAGGVKAENADEERMLLLLRRVSPEVRNAVRTMLEHSAVPVPTAGSDVEH